MDTNVLLQLIETLKGERDHWMREYNILLNEKLKNDTVSQKISKMEKCIEDLQRKCTHGKINIILGEFARNFERQLYLEITGDYERTGTIDLIMMKMNIDTNVRKHLSEFLTKNKLDQIQLIDVINKLKENGTTNTYEKSIIRLQPFSEDDLNIFVKASRYRNVEQVFIQKMISIMIIHFGRDTKNVFNYTKN